MIFLQGGPKSEVTPLV